MDVSAMAHGFYILIILLLLTLSEIQCKASKWYFFYIFKMIKFMLCLSERPYDLEAVLDSSRNLCMG